MRSCSRDNGWSPGTPATPTDRPSTKVLIASDAEQTRRHLRTLLIATVDFKVVDDAADAEEALCLARDARPDMLLLDHELPGVKSPEFASAIRAVRPDLRVVLIS